MLLVSALLLGGCSGGVPEAGEIVSGLNGNTPQEQPLDASGFLEAQEVSVVAEESGQVAQVLVDEADSVEAGQTVVVQDDTLLQADRMTAQAAVTVAQANLDALLADPQPEDVAAAQAGVNEAQAGLVGAQRSAAQAWQIANNPQDVAVAVAGAKVELAEANGQVEGLQARLAEIDYEINIVKNSETEDDNRLTLLNLQRQQTIAQLEAAKARRDGIVAKLEVLNAQQNQPLAEIATAQQAQAQIGIAEAQVALAQAQYDLLVADPLSEQIAIAEAQVELAQAQVDLIDARIARLTLVAPIEGVVTTRAIAVGETASAGVALLTISDLETLKLIIYIPETQIGRVKLGTTVDIDVDAYPNRKFTGEVVRIGLEAEFTPRNVQTEEERVNLVFEVEVRIENDTGLLKPGMPVDATIRE